MFVLDAKGGMAGEIRVYLGINLFAGSTSPDLVDFFSFQFVAVRTPLVQLILEKVHNYDGVQVVGDTTAFLVKALYCLVYYGTLRQVGDLATMGMAGSRS